jgi:hypothetical protein
VRDTCSAVVEQDDGLHALTSLVPLSYRQPVGTRRIMQELSNKCRSLAVCVASYESVNYAEWIDKLGGAGYGWASALTGRLLPAARETSHLFSFEARRYLLSAWYQRDTGTYERRSCDPVEVFTLSPIT